jgi:hypothetical protein
MFNHSVRRAGCFGPRGSQACGRIGPAGTPIPPARPGPLGIFPWWNAVALVSPGKDDYSYNNAEQNYP